LTLTRSLVASPQIVTTIPNYTAAAKPLAMITKKIFVNVSLLYEAKNVNVGCINMKIVAVREMTEDDTP
jgi:hypothetical protein